MRDNRMVIEKIRQQTVKPWGALTICTEILVILVLTLGAAPGFSVKELKAKSVKVVAKQIEFDLDTNQFTATGKPEMTSTDMSMTSDRMVVQLDKQGKDISEMRATGNVVLTMKYQDKGTGQERQVKGTGNEAVLLQAQGKLILSGKARMEMQGAAGKVSSACVDGDKITYLLKDHKLLVESAENDNPTRLEVIGVDEVVTPGTPQK